MVVHAGEHSNRTDEFHAGLCGCTVVYSVHVVRTLCSDPNLPIPSLSATWHSLLHSRLWLHPGSTLMGVAVEFLRLVTRDLPLARWLRTCVQYHRAEHPVFDLLFLSC